MTRVVKADARMAPAWLRRLAPPGLAALTIGTTVWAFRRLTPAEFQHEVEHVRQFAERGVLRGCCEYLLLAVLYGYAAHPWEIAARRAESGQCPAGTCHAPSQR